MCFLFCFFVWSLVPAFSSDLLSIFDFEWAPSSKDAQLFCGYAVAASLACFRLPAIGIDARARLFCEKNLCRSEFFAAEDCRTLS